MSNISLRPPCGHHRSLPPVYVQQLWRHQTSATQMNPIPGRIPSHSTCLGSRLVKNHIFMSLGGLIFMSQQKHPTAWGPTKSSKVLCRLSVKVGAFQSLTGVAMPAVKILKQLANPNVQDIRYATLHDNMLILGSQDDKIGVILTTFSFGHQRDFATENCANRW